MTHETGNEPQLGGQNDPHLEPMLGGVDNQAAQMVGAIYDQIYGLKRLDYSLIGNQATNIIESDLVDTFTILAGLERIPLFEDIDQIDAGRKSMCKLITYQLIREVAIHHPQEEVRATALNHLNQALEHGHDQGNPTHAVLIESFFTRVAINYRQSSPANLQRALVALIASYLTAPREERLDNPWYPEFVDKLRTLARRSRDPLVRSQAQETLIHLPGPTP